MFVYSQSHRIQIPDTSTYVQTLSIAKLHVAGLFFLVECKVIFNMIAFLVPEHSKR